MKKQLEDLEQLQQLKDGGGDHVVTAMQMPQFISSLGVSLLAKEKHILTCMEKNCHCRCVSLKS
jgi:hypothetical protein